VLTGDRRGWLIELRLLDGNFFHQVLGVGVDPFDLLKVVEG
jgi:hypothetical protein